MKVKPNTDNGNTRPYAWCISNSRFRAGCAVVLAVSVMLASAACTHPVRRLVFPAHRIKHVPAFPKNIHGLNRFWLMTEQGKVEGWILQNKTVQLQLPAPAVIIAHGNAELIDHYLDRAVFYRDLGFTVLMGEYRGYGRSSGKPSRERIRDDAIRFYDKLAALPEVDPRRILFHGRSLGGAVLADLAKYRRPAAIILESTFQSIKVMAGGVPDFLLSDRYDTGSALEGYDGAVLIIHGIRDKVVPVAHAYALKSQIPQATLTTGDFGHSDGHASGFDYWAILMGFVEAIDILKRK